MSSELTGYWKERPSEKGGPLSSALISGSDGLLKLMFENKVVSGYVTLMDKCLNVINSVKAPQCFYDWEKPVKPCEVEPLTFSNDFRGNLERYVVSETKEEQDSALNLMGNHWSVRD